MSDNNNKITNVKSTSLSVYPFVDELVDALYTDELNAIIDSENVQVDKRTFLMFIIMYFVTRLYASNDQLSKDSMKAFITDLIRNPVKRSKCIELFLIFENSMGEISYQMSKEITDK